jgi:hypothetical protein
MESLDVMARFLSLTAAAFLAFGISQPAQATTVISFESPALGTGSNAYAYNSTAAFGGAPNYFTGPINGVSFSGMSGIQANGSAWGFTAAPDGTQTAFLQSYSGVYPQGASISFSSSLFFPLVAGQQYDLTFYVEGRAYQGGTPYSVDIGVGTNSFGAPVTTSWTEESIIFTAGATADPISFNVAPQSNSDISIGLDKISISAVPELSTWAMMILGFLGVGFMAARKKSNRLLRFA